MGVEKTANGVILNTKSGASAEIYYYGASVISWKAGGKERLFVSSKSAMDGSKAIRGGIPVVFPTFGPPPKEPAEYAALNQHGFARNQIWSLDKVIMDRDEGVSVRFLAPPPPSEFKHTYKLAYVVTLSAHELCTDVHVVNEGTEDFKFQSLLHSYLAVDDVSKISIAGIPKGTKYLSKVHDFAEFEMDGQDLKITEPVDSVFRSMPVQELDLNYGDGSTLHIRFRGFEDTVIWNPTEKIGKDIADMEDGGWNRYVCIEPGYVREFKTLKAGEEFLGQQVLRID